MQENSKNHSDTSQTGCQNSHYCKKCNTELCLPPTMCL